MDRIFFISIFLFSLIIFSYAADEIPKCGVIYDGTGLNDVETQPQTHFISARWFGFEPASSQLLSFEWAIISKDFATSASISGCRTTKGFEGEPDIQPWVQLPKGQSWAINDTLSLTVGSKYYVLLHAFIENQVTSTGLFTNTDGTLIVAEDDYYYGYEDEDYTDEGEEGYNEDEEEDEGEIERQAPRIQKRDHKDNHKGDHKDGDKHKGSSSKNKDDEEDTFDQGVIAIVFGSVLFAFIAILCILTICTAIFFKSDGKDKYSEK
jgi:hypothetical protein